MKLFKLVLLLVVLSLVALPFLVFDTSSRIASIHKISPQEAKISQTVTSKIQKVLSQRSGAFAITSTELNTVVKVFSYSVPKVNADAALTPLGLALSASIKLNAGSFERYVNISCLMVNEESGLTFDNCYVGQLTIPGSWVKAAIEQSLEKFMGQHSLRFWLSMSKNSKIVGNNLVVNNLNGSALKQALKNSYGEVNGIWSESVPSIRIRQYYDYLKIMKPANNSLAQVTSYLFNHVDRNTQNKSKEELLEHNKAALWAIALRYGSSSFAHFSNVGIKPSKVQKLTLRNRQDLALHFIYSAFIQLNSDQQTAFSIGELKELLDTNRGGSGFSFADLVADKAGVKFAEYLTSNSADLRQAVKKLSSSTDESLFMPNINNKPEGLTEQEFKRRFSDINSAAYRTALAAIESEISQLPLYK